ncbi:hypothetical protein HKBW3S47_01612, partial [Candidatus Hakubella thermalkaliphila]
FPLKMHLNFHVPLCHLWHEGFMLSWFTGDEAIMRNYLENKPNILRVRGL